MAKKGKKRGVQIRVRSIELRYRGVLTSKGEQMSLAAIGRTVEPPVTRIAVYRVIDGLSTSRKIRHAINRELGCDFFFVG